VHPRRDARGSESALEVALPDPAEGSDDIADDVYDDALVDGSRHDG